MRWIALGLILLSIPLFVSYLNGGERRRDHLLVLLAFAMFAAGSIQFDASIITWPLWEGIAKGMVLSFVDSIAIALLVTQKRQPRHYPFLVLFMLFAIPVLLATAISTIKMASLFVVFGLAQLLFLYVVLTGEFRRVSALRSVMIGWALGMIVQAGFVISQKLSGVVQASGTIVHQNTLGMIVELSALPLIAAILEGEKNKLVWAGALAGCVCVAGGGSRATMGFFAAAVVLLIVLSLIRRSTPRKWRILGIGVVAAAIFIPLSLGTLQDRFGDREMTGAIDDGRESLERAAIAIAADHPFGVGPNTFVQTNNTQGYAQDARIEWGGNLRNRPVHSAYLLARAETGWAGQATFLLLICGVAIAGYRTGFRCRNIAPPGIALGSACGITMVALHSNYEFAWYLPEVQRLFFVNAALIAGCMAIAKRTEQENRNARRLRAAAARDTGQAGARPAMGQGVG